MNCYLVLRLDANGKLQWPPTELQKWEKFKEIYKGKPIEFQAGPLSPLRTDEHMKFVRMKIGHICKYTGYRAEELLTLLMESLDLGESTQLQTADLVAQFFIKFRRMSTKRLTKAHVNAISDQLDEMLAYINSNMPPHAWINWPEKVERAKKLLATEAEEQTKGDGSEWDKAAATASSPEIDPQFPVQ
jgi:hypothetical protein